MVLHGGSSEITDIDVNKAVMDTKKNFKKHKKEWFEKVEEDSNKLFDIAVVAAKSLNKVVLDMTKEKMTSLGSKANYQNMQMLALISYGLRDVVQTLSGLWRLLVLSQMASFTCMISCMVRGDLNTKMAHIYMVSIQ